MNDWQRAERHADRALDLFDRGRLSEAESELRKALAINPDQPDWHFNLGLTLEASDRDSEAMERFEHAAELAPEHVFPRLAAGSMALRLLQWDTARRWFARAIELEPDCEEAHAGMIDAWVAEGDHEEGETAFYLAQQVLEGPGAFCLQAIAESLCQRKKWKRAEWCLQESLRIEPGIPGVRSRLAMVMAETGRAEQAMRIFTDQLRETPDDVEALLVSAQLLVKLDRRPDAIGYLERLLRKEPTHHEAHELLARLALDAHHYDRAIFEYQLVLRLHPHQVSAMLGLADALVATARVSETRRLLSLVFQQRELLVGVDQATGQVIEDRLTDLLLSVGLDREAAITMAGGIERVGPTADRLRRLALSKFRCGDLDGGRAASRRVLRFDASCIRSMHNLALSALYQGRFRTASGWIARGLLIQPRDEGLRRLRILVWVHRLLGRMYNGRMAAR